MFQFHSFSQGKHAYKFVVDDEWRFAPDQVIVFMFCLSVNIKQPTIADIEGRINNFIDVSDFQPYVGDESFFEKSKGTILF
jgi:5'-AMP-activated protein kinase, regulatory beta subunit